MLRGGQPRHGVEVRLRGDDVLAVGPQRKAVRMIAKDRQGIVRGLRGILRALVAEVKGRSQHRLQVRPPADERIA